MLLPPQASLAKKPEIRPLLIGPFTTMKHKKIKNDANLFLAGVDEKGTELGKDGQSPPMTCNSVEFVAITKTDHKEYSSLLVDGTISSTYNM